jgi:hypothetical protein
MRLDAGAVGGRLVDGRDDLDVAVFHRDLDAEADEAALHLFAQLGQVLLVQVDGMRVERIHHAGDGVRQQLLVVDLLDIIALDQGVHVGQLAQLVQRQRRLAAFLRQCRVLDRGGHPGHHAEADQTDVLEFLAHAIPWKMRPESAFTRT